MNEKILHNFLELCQSIDANTPKVKERIRNAGFKSNPAIVSSIAKYWVALERLAAE